MSELAPFSLKNRNPDVLTCIANLSNDEVFTPPEFAGRMLDTLAEAWSAAHNGENIWANRNVTFLDPFTKSGVFLREIVERLTDGLADQIPDIHDRVNHIVKNQIFGIAITQLTSLLARRSVYCSKAANGAHSIGKDVFDSEAGNIWFESVKHSWVGGRNIKVVTSSKRAIAPRVVDRKCEFCGVGENALNREEGLETHAYAFIHNRDIQAFTQKIFGGKMQFDVIIGNPPYQLDDGGFGTSAGPIYDKFVDQAKKLDPRYLTMVIPARWFSGGKGLDSFRDEMLNDRRLRSIDDFPDSSEVFPGVQIKGGVCYFLWDRDNPGDCRVTNYFGGVPGPSEVRPLLEPGADTFIRYNLALPILKKVIEFENGGSNFSETGVNLPASLRFAELVSSRKPFGLDTSFKGATTKSKGQIKIYRNGGVGYARKSEVLKSNEIIEQWKVFIPYAGSGSDAFPHPILGRPFIGEPGSACSETYLYIGPFGSESEAQNAISYLSSRLFRFLVLLHKPSQHATSSVYAFVPKIDFGQKWSDEMLCERYGISKSEFSYIETLVRPMELGDE
jgi:site-specific DNA-methyltransferase (adenine-specific)